MKQSISYAVLSLALVASAELVASQKSIAPVAKPFSTTKDSRVVASEQQALRTAAFIKTVIDLVHQENEGISVEDSQNLNNLLQNNSQAIFAPAVENYKKAYAEEFAKVPSMVRALAYFREVELPKEQQDALKKRAMLEAIANSTNLPQFVTKTIAAHAVEIYDAFVASQPVAQPQNNWKRFIGVRSGAAVAALAVATIVLVKTGFHKNLTLPTAKRA